MKVFIHIPKTAGTSVCKVLHDSVYFKSFMRLNPKRTTHPKDFLSSVGPVIEQSIKSEKYECIGGHFGFAAHPSLSSKQHYFVMLRNPIDRVASEYYYMFQQGFYYKELIDSEQLSLVDYLYHPQTYYLNNLQTRLVSGASFDLEHDQVTEADYEVARANLHAFAAVGVTEQFVESLALYYKKLNWSRIPIFQLENKNDRRPPKNTLSEEEIREIRKREVFDLRLYEDACVLLNKQLSDLGEELDPLVSRILNPTMVYSYYLRMLKLQSKIQYKLSDFFTTKT